jgi:predicted choloylglycine hydrolase
MILLINSIYDLSTSMGCSTLIVEKERSKTGAPIFGRNFDWMPTKGLPEQTVVAVMEPKGKLAFALVTIAPIAGCVSGMNEAGLCLTLNEISIKQTKDKSTFNWDGIPTLLAFRRVLEECRTIDEAEKLLKSLKRTTCACMTICDAHGGAVLEITPKTVIRRTANLNVCCCTNHFRTDELCVDKKCSRIDTLLKLETDTGKLGVSEVFHQLDLVNQKAATLQSMVFEPTTHTLHLKLGDGKTTSSRAKSVMLKLSDYWGKK